jgi:hypothetical protein
MNVCESEWYMWVDAGSLRQEWPEIEKFGTRQLPETPGVYLQLLKPIIDKKFFSFPDTFIAGSNILFHKEYVNAFVNSYDEALKIYEKEKISLISDQHIMASIASKISFLYPIFYRIHYQDQSCDQLCGSIFLIYLALKDSDILLRSSDFSSFLLIQSY